ncbi:methyl-accepting chemotaxis protein [Bosea sp. OAE752]|jgi:methyl-accepting chemotaxis protein|uniref:Chemotaxis protein n=1 Tax=Bosea spartocytisi TaxID=2773451 RepID=A0A927EG66_9HYPH|nr:methyl-accepting chemotaxis protein [Bosea spartocytisi]MBD3849274.1 chemotaxis protein [Bosea spartocytisi]MCT4471580.1 methyl-accepting chemotaxis protein [Bosea spartocytisi]
MNDVARFRAQFARLLLIILWINAGLMSLTPGAQLLLGQQTLILAGIGLAALGTLALYLYRIDWPARQITSMATLGQVMLLVYAFAGHPYQSDMHMYFFAMLAVLAGWLDWRIFLPATVAIAAHHLALSLLQPAGVFANGGDTGRVLLHGAIVSVQAAALSLLVWALRQALETSETERRQADAAREIADEARRHVAETTAKAASERQRILNVVANDFENAIAGIARDVIASVQSLRAASQQMKHGAVEVLQRSTAASRSSRQTSANVVAVTQVTSELAQSFAEVDRQVAETARIVGAATLQAGNVLHTVGDLSRKADEIGNIAGVISTIAKHTNLLALNASIEAARLGRSGGGFTIVAQEIKSLATQTWRATEEIQGQIEAIHQSGSEAIAAIDAMNLTIGSLNQISGAVAIVVEQQNVATAGIAENIRQAADETVTAAGHIDIVSRVAAETDEAASHIALSADELSLQSSHLDAEVAQFLGRVRAA